MSLANAAALFSLHVAQTAATEGLTLGFATTFFRLSWITVMPWERGFFVTVDPSTSCVLA